MQLYTIGYATKSLNVFIEQLKHYKIDVVADVRSVPYSKVFHDYHREAIAQSLKQANIRYVYLGEELGPRSKNDDHYNECGQVQFDRLMTSELFKIGIERIELGLSKTYSIALMCAEKDPATCHRSLLIAYFLEHRVMNKEGSNRNNIEVLHIQHDGTIETQYDLERRLLDLHNLGDDLFMSPKESKEQAYKRQLEATSYIKQD